jgi:hypothetical protein
MTNQEIIATAVCSPQGYCPNTWVACINGRVIVDARGGTRRFKTEAAALKAAKQERITRWLVEA